MKFVNKKDFLIYLLILLAVTYLKSIYLSEVYTDNWWYQALIFFCSDQFVNILWLIPILIQVFFISKKIYVELNYFDLRYKNRNNFLKNIFLCFIKEHTIYTTSFIVVQIIGLMILTGIPFKFDVGILELFCKYYIEIMFYIWLLILVSLVIQKYTISFLIELTLLLVLLNILKSSLFPIISLYYNYSFNFLTLPCICFVLHFIKKIYISRDLLGGIKYDIRDWKLFKND